MSDNLWKALADAYVQGAKGYHANRDKLIDWKAEAEPIAAAHRNQIIRDLMEKAEAEAKDAANSAGIEKHYTWQAQVAWWLKSQLEGGE